MEIHDEQWRADARGGLPRNARRRQLLQAGGAAALMGTGLLAACGGDDAGSPGGLGRASGDAAAPTAQAGKTRYTVSGRQILQNGEPYFMRGVCYSPLPIGANFGWPPIGDFFTPFWSGIWRRDLPMMKAMGINSIRLYSTTPYIDPVNPSSGLNSHIEFLDMCQQYGVSVWASYPIDKGIFQSIHRGDANLERIIQQGVEDTAKEMADHPAVIGFIIGNELNNGTDRDMPEWWAWLDRLGAASRQKAPDKLTMISLVDDSMFTVRAAHRKGRGVPNIDVMGINSYRGRIDIGFDNLFDTFAEADKRPLLLTEWGCPASTRNASGQIMQLPGRAQGQADYLRSHWLDIRAHTRICSGGYVFAWSDEWWKDGAPAEHNAGPATARNPAYPGGWGDEEWFGIHSVAVNGRPPADPVVNGVHIPDILTPRAAADTLRELWTAS